MFNRRSILVASLISLAASMLTGCAANTDETSDEAADMPSAVGMDFIRVDGTSSEPPDGSEDVASTPLPEEDEAAPTLETKVDWGCLVDPSKTYGDCWTCINHKGYYGKIYNSAFCGQVCVVPGGASSTGPC